MLLTLSCQASDDATATPTVIVVVIIVQIVLYALAMFIVGALVVAFFGGLGAMTGGPVIRY